MDESPLNCTVVIDGPSEKEVADALVSGDKVGFTLADPSTWKVVETRGTVDSVSRLGTGYRVELVTKLGLELGFDDTSVRLEIIYTTSPRVIGKAGYLPPS